jgi:hypothetical protein
MRKLVFLFLLMLFRMVSFSQEPKDSFVSVSPNEPRPEHPAEFPGGRKEWISYLIHHLNRELGYKYLTVPKGTKNAKQTVSLLFEIDTSGHTTHIIVENLQEVHPEMAKEGIRIISASPAWNPATLNGKPVTDRRRQKVTFVSGSIL